MPIIHTSRFRLRRAQHHWHAVSPGAVAASTKVDVTRAPALHISGTQWRSSPSRAIAPCSLRRAVDGTARGSRRPSSASSFGVAWITRTRGSRPAVARRSRVELRLGAAAAASSGSGACNLLRLARKGSPPLIVTPSERGMSQRALATRDEVGDLRWPCARRAATCPATHAGRWISAAPVPPECRCAGRGQHRDDGRVGPAERSIVMGFGVGRACPSLPSPLPFGRRESSSLRWRERAAPLTPAPARERPETRGRSQQAHATAQPERSLAEGQRVGVRADACKLTPASPLQRDSILRQRRQSPSAAVRPASGIANSARASGFTNCDSGRLPMPRPPLARSAAHSSRSPSRTAGAIAKARPCARRARSSPRCAACRRRSAPPISGRDEPNTMMLSPMRFRISGRDSRNLK